MIRKYIPQEKRKIVYEKYNGHCAYCGKEMTDTKLLEFSQLLDNFIYIGADDKPHVACRGIEKVLKEYDKYEKANNKNKS